VSRDASAKWVSIGVSFSLSIRSLVYNLHSKKKHWLQNLALEAETAVTQLPTTDRNFYRKLVADLLPHFALATLDITNMYANIPVAETKKILIDIMKNNLLDSRTQHELLNWYDVITKQNYFINNNDIKIENDGLAMSAPSSNIIA
jgi:hypothetical protein